MNDTSFQPHSRGVHSAADLLRLQALLTHFQRLYVFVYDNEQPACLCQLHCIDYLTNSLFLFFFCGTIGLWGGRVFFNINSIFILGQVNHLF